MHLPERRPTPPRPDSPATGALLLLLAVLLLPLGCAPARPPVTQPPQAMRSVPPKVGLALGGGGARGFAEIGVLRVLEQEKIPIGLVAGTSVGSLVGAMYADSGRVLDAEFMAVAVKEADLFDYSALSFFSGGLVQGQGLESFLRAHLKHANIEEMKVPFAAVAVDLSTGKPIVFQRGSVARAVHASCAIPGVFVPVQIGGATYVDGGVVDPVPADVARRLGAGVVIAVAIPRGLPLKAPGNAVEVAYQGVAIMQEQITKCRLREADVVIRPDVSGVAFDDFSQKKRLMEAGEAAARLALPEIRAAIAAKTRLVPEKAPSPGTGAGQRP